MPTTPSTKPALSAMTPLLANLVKTGSDNTAKAVGAALEGLADVTSDLVSGSFNNSDSVEQIEAKTAAIKAIINGTGTAPSSTPTASNTAALSSGTNLNGITTREALEVLLLSTDFTDGQKRAMNFLLAAPGDRLRIEVDPDTGEILSLKKAQDDLATATTKHAAELSTKDTAHKTEVKTLQDKIDTLEKDVIPKAEVFTKAEEIHNLLNSDDIKKRNRLLSGGSPVIALPEASFTKMLDKVDDLRDPAKAKVAPAPAKP